MSDPEPKKRRRSGKRQVKAPEAILTAEHFTHYPGLEAWLNAQAHAHARTPGEEITYRLLLAYNLDQRRGEKGKLAPGSSVS